LELTASSASSSGIAPPTAGTGRESGGCTFSGSYAPLEVFLSWTRSVHLDQNFRLLAPDVGHELFARVRTGLAKGAGRAHAVHRDEDMMQGAEREFLDWKVWGDIMEPRHLENYSNKIDNGQSVSAQHRGGGGLGGRARWL
jgi:hypothetical protein